MSRSVVPYIELAASHLLKFTKIRIGAYGCGIHGEFLERSKKQIGLQGAFEDPICSDFGRRESPSSHVVIQVIKGDDKFRQKSSLFRSFYSAAAVGAVYELWPSNVINFAERALDDWSKSKLVEQFVSSDFEEENSTFTSTFRIVAFIDTSLNSDAQNQESMAKKSIQNALLVALPRLAAQVLPAGGRVGTAVCATYLDSDHDAVDCESIGVAWLPDVKIFGVNQLNGISLLNDEITEVRDIQIALEVLSNTVAALLELNSTDLRDEESEIDEEPPTRDGSEKIDVNFNFNYENDFDALDAPEERALLDESPFQKIADKEELASDKPAQIATNPAKPKLAPRSEVKNISSRAHRESSGRVGGRGTIYGKISGSSTVGAIGS